MLDYAHQRTRECIQAARRVVLATSGPGGIQAGIFPCEALDICLYLLVPETSDLLYNLEHGSRVALLSEAWEIKGIAHRLSKNELPSGLELLEDPSATWCALLEVEPLVLHIRASQGWGFVETIELGSRSEPGL